MRCTVASVTALAAAFVVALCLWPDTPAHKLISRATADGTDKPTVEKSSVEKPEAVQKDLAKLVKAAQDLPDDQNAEREAELNDQFGEFVFQGTPLTDVMDFFHNAHHTGEYYFDNAALKDAGIDPTTTLVTISFKHIRLKTFLDMMLSPFNLGYHFRDGIMIITTVEKLNATLETRVYDCHDILAANTGKYRSYIAEISPTTPAKADQPKTNRVADSRPMGGPPGGPPVGPAGMGPPIGGPPTKSFAFGPATNENKGTSVPAAAGKLGGDDASQATADHPHTPVNDLIDVITTSIAPSSWLVQGGPGSICEYDGLLIVDQTSQIQSDVADLLDKLSTKLASRAPK